MITIIMDQLVHQALMMIDTDSNDDENEKNDQNDENRRDVYYQAKTRMKRL